MWQNRLFAGAAALLIAGIGWSGGALQAKAEAMLGGPYAPDGLRIPAEIELLTDTPYYARPSHGLNDKPEGEFAPQTVKVLKTEPSWSVSGTTWQIETMFGPRWIQPKPWEIDIAPPKRITLLEETPLYDSKSEDGGSIASLSPQEVQVVGAEKQWFYTNDPNSKAWIQIHTTWLGDLWAHIPVNRIGTVQTVQRKMHFNGELARRDATGVLGVYSPDDAAAVVLKGDYSVIGEYTTVYDRGYEIQTDDGPVWTRDKGIELLAADETVQLTSETPLVADLWDGNMKELGLLKDEKVTAFEKIEEPLQVGFDVYTNGSAGTWYHVRTSKGTGWINKRYAEPATAVPVHWKVALSGQHELERYPDVPFAGSTLLLRQMTVEATAAWDDPGGMKWLRVAVDGRPGWIPLSYGEQVRTWDEDADTALHIELGTIRGVGIVKSDDGSSKLFNGEQLGYTEDGVEYLDAGLLARELRFTGEKVSYADAVTYTQGDYSFTLESGFRNAIVRWHGAVQRVAQLQDFPRHTDDSWYVSLRDARTLFGLEQTGPDIGNVMYLYEKDYKVELGDVPSRVSGGRLALQAFLYESVPSAERSAGRTPLLISLEVNGEEGGDSLISHEEAVVSGSDRSPEALTSLFRLTASRPLPPGPHQVDVLLRVGERIVWEQTISVTEE